MKQNFKYLILIVCLLGIFQIKAQDSLRRSELGSTILTVNSFNTNYTYAQNRPSFEILNGLFYRYNKNRNSYRALISYGENKIDFKSPPEFTEGKSGNVSNKNFMLGAGIQHNLKKNKDWLYGFIDLCYRNTFSTGTDIGGGYSYAYSSSANGLDAYLGLGFKFKIAKQLCLSPELTYNIYFGRTDTKFNFGNARSTSVTYDLNIKSILKIHFTAKF